MGIDIAGTWEPSPVSTLRPRPCSSSSSSSAETWSWKGAAPQASDSVTNVADADKLSPSSMLRKEEALDREGSESNAVDDKDDEYDPEDADENSAGVVAGTRGGRTMEEEGDSRSSPVGARTGSM